MELILIYIIPFIVCLSSVIYTIVRLIQIAMNKVKSYRFKNDDIDELSIDFKYLAGKTKFKRLIFIIWMTIGYSILLFGTLYYINSKWMTNVYQRTSENAQKYMNVRAPNINYTTMITKYDSIVSSHIYMDTFKNIDGYPVPWSPMSFDYGTLMVTNNAYIGSPTEINNAYYTHDTKQKVATFFLPKLNYKSDDYFGIQPTHEASDLVKEKNQVAEVAVSFDKPYSYFEIQSMIPKNLLINWYWIGFNDDTNVNAASAPYSGLASNDVAQDSPKDDYGLLSYETYEDFIKNATDLTWGTVVSNDFDSYVDLNKQIKKYPNLDKAKFSGVILTGRTENLTGLDKNKWVFSTNIGVTAPIKSYITPIK
ncbi:MULTISPECIES: anti sigma factor C-terminal domain-containing protein [unclassified Lactococcus]|uniref:anti sigma factor C-terminal domain-containing protein n=1 Tax=unclassified Lactococcus TaxID=2643510 RepID=UPI0011CBF546|nr:MULTISPECIES: anti sigma factor C-terminal domain-containing protein [unclassified Lactococcus]MQW23986.1 anti-sigma factor [Lactococcus sp. dk101]TXK36928.1 anti-sigma factor [Lactococcus sp. dk310]TXK47089.1 anti-sigma factor [Lactococcus sp. dk322]